MATDIRSRKITSLPELIPSYDITGATVDYSGGPNQYNLDEWINGLYLLLAYNEDSTRENFKLKLWDLINKFIRNFILTEYVNDIQRRLDEIDEQLEEDFATKDDIQRLTEIIQKYHPDGEVFNILYNVDDNIRLISWKNTITASETVRILYELKSDNYKLDDNEENMIITNANYQLDKTTKTILISGARGNVNVTLRTKKLNSLFMVLYTNDQLRNIFGTNYDYSDRTWVSNISNIISNEINNSDNKYFTDEIFSTFGVNNPINSQANNNGYYTIIISKKYIDMDASTLSTAPNTFAQMKLIFKDSNGNKYELFSSSAAVFGNPNTNVHIDFERPYGEFTYNMFKDNNNSYPEYDNKFVVLRFNMNAYNNLYFYKLN